MKPGFAAKVDMYRKALRRGLHGPQALAFLPALALAAFWLGGEPALIVTALGLPVVFLFAGGSLESDRPIAQSGKSDMLTQAAAVELVDINLAQARSASLSTACMVIECDGFADVSQRAGESAADALRDLTLTRLRNMLRKDDHAARMGDNRFVVVFGPTLRLDLERLLQLAARLQAGLEEPASVHNTMRYLSVCVGFCGSSRLPDTASGQQMLESAQIALAEAVANGPSAVRAWSENMRAAHQAQKTLLQEVERALANGQIQPWFQPQVDTSTGEISGVEALARWIHPERGIVPPAQFLRCLEESGQMGRLSEVILQHSLTALRSWDKAGLDIPRISVNFSDAELRNPKLVERIQWELDRFGLTPSRLGIEVLETVIAQSPDGIIARNITALSDLGCQIDLDDFGTGHASITALRRFKVHRLKIDRSFVTRIDRDEEQRRLLTAILGMADRLGLETLAEGVESVGEHALLSQLGCEHVQGYGIARPMAVDQIVQWAHNHAERIASAKSLGRSSSG
ncbi:bifunctional diguanylate cyclase/phosphodiesterase [Cognatishimia sp. F0-27]|uniref:putative bifunctional diguanylate cyclase/phosphodiesterase n=1 Tax=Cognatishimia sp. F0-27 TaxID=2816855 RepID=UPI001D0C1651|nr:GGDEF domain-containing phosphodiesterase [Cognatishimia sp. F0-27]MCC1494155.1 EAL domain-containing protein [Cognatishimia sp. F0-27]